MSGKNCSSACITKDHATFGECMRSKNLNVKPNLMFQSEQKSWDQRLDRHASAVRQGLTPEGTKTHQIDAAFKKADASA